MDFVEITEAVVLGAAFDMDGDYRITVAMEAMRTKDGHNLVRNHMPEPILEKDERGLVKGMLTYK